MAAKVGLGVEGLRTKVALKRPLSSVAAHMPLEVALLVESLGTVRTPMGLLARVALQVTP